MQVRRLHWIFRDSKGIVLGVLCCLWYVIYTTDTTALLMRWHCKFTDSGTATRYILRGKRTQLFSSYPGDTRCTSIFVLLLSLTFSADQTGWGWTQKRKVTVKKYTYHRCGNSFDFYSLIEHTGCSGRRAHKFFFIFFFINHHIPGGVLVFGLSQSRKNAVVF